jgi:hypothetical protein
MAKKRYRKPGELHDVQCLLWTLMREVEDRVFETQAEPLTLDELPRVCHAMSQLASSYLKVCEGGTIAALVARLETLEARQQLMESFNGHNQSRTAR